jgi:putative chitinase
MYNGKILKLPDKKIDEKKIPSLVIASTMDTELAHLDGYNGIFIKSDISPTEFWIDQIKKTEEAALANPLRLFPLFSYDPRRYRRPFGYHQEQRYPRPDLYGLVGEEGCEFWKEPFAHIVGHDHTDKKIKKIWIGFCMNPTLGFRPFDERCKYIPEFYKECEKADIPILANCAFNGIVTHEANTKKYIDFNRKELIVRLNIMKERGKKECTSHYCGKERVADGDNLDYFYRNYGHPRNWIPVLEHCENLRLCLAGFGGNSEWRRKEITEWTTVTPGNRDDIESLPREWLRCIIKLTAKYKNVYADISGLNIDDDNIKRGLQKVLRLIHKGHPDFKHLKYKLMFGSGWYFTGRDYGDYCNYAMELFRGIDISKTEIHWKLWERISLVNPWNFYINNNEAKTGRIGKIYDILKDKTKGNAKTMLNKMNDLFAEKGEVVKYVSDYSEDMATKDTDNTKNIKNTTDKNGSKDLTSTNAKEDNDLIKGGIIDLITLEELIKINGNSNRKDCEKYIDALNEVLPLYEINTPLRLAHFLAQILHESDFLKGMIERFRYGDEKKLISVFGKYFSRNGGETVHTYTDKNGKEKSIELDEPKRKAANYCIRSNDNSTERQRKYEAIANYVYAGSRVGNGKESTGNGYKYRGRGLIQLTGLANYTDFGNSRICQKLGLTKGEVLANPDIIIRDAITIVHSACWFWDTKKYKGKKANEWADMDDIIGVTQIINGGDNGLDHRKQIFGNAKKVLGLP